jgi:hypothetical protein
MEGKMSKRGIIYQEPDKRCEYCGKYDECRPFGKNNEQICFACMKSGINKEIAYNKVEKYLFGKRRV